MSIVINLDLISVVAAFITNEKLFDVSLFNGIVSIMLNDIEKKKLTILLNILSSDNLDINPTTFSKSFGPIINSLIGILQVFFYKINLDDFNNKLVDWLENDNENEQQYLDSAETAKSVHQLIESFNGRSKKGFIIDSTQLFLRDINDEEHLMIRCYFTPKYNSN